MYGYFVDRNYKGNLPYTDLAVERRRADTGLPGIEYRKTNTPLGSYERVKISTKNGADYIGKPLGIYDTLQADRLDRLDSDERMRLSDALADELNKMVEDSDIFPGRLLVAGLGNRRLTPDSLGCEAADRVIATMHLKEFDPMLFRRQSCAEIAVCTPGVAAESGLDAAVVVKGICDLIRPDAVIAIDAIATRDVARLGSTIQISNSGISPGSGLGNCRLALCPETVGVPVIAVGLPTVIDSRLLSGDDSDSEPMFVSPKEINEIISASAEVIGGAINRAFGIYP
jgi:spore protease